MLTVLKMLTFVNTESTVTVSNKLSDINNRLDRFYILGSIGYSPGLIQFWNRNLRAKYKDGTKHLHTIVDRLRLVIWNNDSHPKGVNVITTFPLTDKAVHSKIHTCKKSINNPPAFV